MEYSSPVTVVDYLTLEGKFLYKFVMAMQKIKISLLAIISLLYVQDFLVTIL